MKELIAGATRPAAWLALALALFGGPAPARDFDTGLAAHDAGAVATALEEWTPLAEQGNAMARYNPDMAYANGHGVPQSSVEAYVWVDLAAAKGNTGASASRDNVAGRLTGKEIAIAQTMVQCCLVTGYPDCDQSLSRRLGRIGHAPGRPPVAFLRQQRL